VVRVLGSQTFVIVSVSSQSVERSAQKNLNKIINLDGNVWIKGIDVL